jgi:hypothetical protein
MRVFVSHSVKDYAFVKQLVMALEKRGVECLVYNEKIQSDNNWIINIGTPLESSDFIVVVFSPDAVASRAVNLEIDTAEMTEGQTGGTRSRIVPVIYRPCRTPEWLTSRKWFDFRETDDDGCRFGEVVDSMVIEMQCYMEGIRKPTRAESEVRLERPDK